MPEIFTTDSPIDDPKDDLFGLAPFAEALADSITKIPVSHGVVVAINGSWGLGKSSALNLIRHYLSKNAKANEVLVTTFNPWWYVNSSAMAQGFFDELDGLVERSSTEQAKKSLKSLALKATGAASGLADLAKVVPLWGGVAAEATKGVAELASFALGGHRSLGAIHAELADALRSQEKRIVVIVDDIDRLSPDDAVEVFNLVKSVGRLPNVVYLLSYDRIVAERLVRYKFPSDGAQYLEKIVQAAFEIPTPQKSELARLFLSRLNAIVGDSVNQSSKDSFQAKFLYIVEPLIESPRSVVRLINTLATSLPPVLNDIDIGDFVALEAIRLFRPDVHLAIRTHRNDLTGSFENGLGTKPTKEELDKRILGAVAEDQREWARVALKRLFPKTQAIWGNTTVHGYANWRRRRLVCADEHFDSYFRFLVSSDALPQSEIVDLIAKAGDGEFVKAYFRNAAETPRGRGTKAAVALDFAYHHRDSISTVDIRSFVIALMEVADVLDTAADRDAMGGLSLGFSRVESLVESLLKRLQPSDRLATFEAAMPSASLGFVLSLIAALVRADSGESDVFDADAVEHLRNLALAKIREAVDAGTLEHEPKLVWLLFRWANINRDYADIKTWVQSKLGDRQFIIRFAGGGVRENVVWGGSDELPNPPRVTSTTDVASLGQLVEIEALMQRAREVLAGMADDDVDKQVLHDFIEAVDASASGDGR